jgi:hypothetical protein
MVNADAYQCDRISTIADPRSGVIQRSIFRHVDSIVEPQSAA